MLVDGGDSRRCHLKRGSTAVGGVHGKNFQRCENSYGQHAGGRLTCITARVHIVFYVRSHTAEASGHATVVFVGADTMSTPKESGHFITFPYLTSTRSSVCVETLGVRQVM